MKSQSMSPFSRLRRDLIGSALAMTGLATVRGAWAQDAESDDAPLPLQPDEELPSQAEEFIATIAGDILAVAHSDLPPDDKKLRFQALLEAHADIPTIAVFSLGKYASRLAEEMREQYFTLVAGYISRIFVTHSTNLGGRAVNVTGSTIRSERETLVQSMVWFDSGRALPVIWRVIATDVGFKVFDVSVNGIWLAIQQRSEFVSLIQENNGDINALLAFLTRNN
jgi:phospholipid transport system substrate-binding protein